MCRVVLLFCLLLLFVVCVSLCLFVLACKEGESGLVHHPEFLKQGLLFVQDVAKKVGLGPTWHRYFCQFHKEENGTRGKTRQMKFTPVGHHGSLPSTDYMDVKSCFRSKTEDVERRFCFEVEFYLSSQRYHMYSNPYTIMG
ncbi:Rho GTPase-activating protein 26 [Geodia barretti]|uniref:Rho GTPase-activating protein 26 n=1 Tax=Geodia barretti TaxID=519541 RepID=A0AA35SZ79_GEOBA|nr:Rho GTPase-activating protein 26 [Geodia barretti]